MAAFNLTAELNLRGPSNLNQVIGDIRRELSSVRLDLTIDPRASRNIQAITGNVNNLSAALRNAQSNATALNAALSNLGSGVSGANSGLNNLNNNLNNANNAMRNAGNGSREAASQMEAFGRQAGLAVRRFAAFSVVTGTIYAFSRALSSAYSEFMNFNDGFVKLQQVTGGNANSLKSLVQEITRLSQTFGVSSKSILDVSKTLAQAGLSASDTQKALEALAKSALAPSFDSLNDTVEGSIALMRQFGISAGDLESALGSINSVAAKFAVEAGDIITAIQRTGGVFAAASKGVSEGKDALNEFIAVFTSVRATTRESAETIATGLRTIFTRIQRGGTIEALKQYGVSLTDVEGKFVGAYEAVRRLSDGLKKLDPRDVRFSKIVEELGGFRQIGKVLPLIQEFATAQQALNVAQRGAGSLTTDAAKAQEALAVRITKVREEFIGLVRDIGQSKGFQNFVDISLKLASALISVADAAKNVLPAITAIAAIRGISNISGFVRGFSSSARGLPAANNRRGYARGGFVPGSGDGDTVPAMLTPGEFVIRKKAVQAIGVDRLQKMNRYASGGLVQKFGQAGPVDYVPGSAMRALRELTREFLMPRSRKGGRRKISFVGQQAVSISKNIPPDLLAQIEEEGRLVYGTGLGGLPKGDPGLVVDKVINLALAKVKKKKEGKLKKTQGALTFSAAGLQRGPRAPKGQAEIALARYQQDPEYRQLMGMQGGNIGLLTSIKEPLAAFRKSGGKTNLSGIFSREQSSKIQAALPKYIESLAGEPAKQAKAKLASEYFSSFIAGGSALKAGHATAFTETINGMLKDNFVTFARGGMVQRFAQKIVKPESGRVKKPKTPYYIDEKQIKAAQASGTGTRMFGLAGILGGVGKGAFTQELLAKPKGQNGERYPVLVKVMGGTLNDKNPTFASSIDKSIKIAFGGLITDVATQLAGKLGNGTQLQTKIPLEKIEQNSGFQQVVGSVFEGALNMIGAPFFEKNEQTKSIDFPFGLGSASSLFGIPGNIPTDATRTIGSKGKGPGGFIKQIERYLEAENKGLYTKAMSGESLVAKKLIDKGSYSYEQAVAINSVLRKYGIRANVGRKMLKATKDQLRKGLAGNKQAEDELTQLGFFAKGGIVHKFSKGGSTEDTVPALLTPGEFVINKRAASRLGSSTLNKLNRADKIQGFNNGGSVGDIQSFALGGSVLGINFGALSRAFDNLITRMTLLNRNLPSGSGWVGSRRGRLSQLTNGGVRDTAGDQARNMAKDPMTLVFGAGLLGDILSKAGAPALGAGVAGGVGTFGVASELTKAVGLAGPFGKLIAVTAALTSAWTEYIGSIREGIKATEQKKLEESSTRLEKAFQNLSSNVGSVKDNFASINGILAEQRKSLGIQEDISRLQYTPYSSFAPLGLQNAIGGTANFLTNAPATGLAALVNATATVGSLGMYNGPFNIPTEGYNFGFGQMSDLSRNQYASELSTQAGPIAERTVAALRESMTREGVSLNQAITRQGRGDPNEEAKIRRLIAIERMGTQYTAVEARIEQLRSQPASRDRDIAIKQAEQKREGFITLAVAAMEAEDAQRKKVNLSIKENVNSIELFIQSIRGMEASISRASTAFESSFRNYEMRTGYKIGRPVSVERVDRSNENIFRNVSAYSPEELRRETNRLGTGLGLAAPQTEALGTNIIAFRTLQNELPKIFQEIARSEASTPGEVNKETRLQTIEQTLSTKLRPMLETVLGKDKASEALDRVVKQIDSRIGDSFNWQELINGPELNKLLEFYGTSVEFAANSTKALNDVQDRLVDAMNNYVSALARATEYEDRAASIRAESAIQLREARGEAVPLAERNALFDQSINRLTSVYMPNQGIVAGTNDPATIRARLDQVMEEKNRLEEKKKTEGGLDRADNMALANLTNSAQRLDGALNKLANDGTKASNALRKIQEIRQVQQARRGAVVDIFSNMFDVEAMSTMANQLRSFSAVMRGATVPAFAVQEGAKGLRIAQQSMSSEQALKAEREYIEKATRSLVATGDMAPDTARQIAQFALNQSAEERDATAKFKQASDEMAKANEEFASMARQSAQDSSIIISSAAQKFAEIVKTAGIEFAGSVTGNNVPSAVPTTGAANGGIIYASRGKYVNFQPRGTDTVPAMLTPGEFVINAKSAKKNMGLLQAINNGNKGYSKGGVVYLQDGGVVGSFSTSVDSQIAQLLEQLRAFDQQTENLVNSLSTITGGTDPQLDRKISLLRSDRQREKQPLINQLQQLQTQQTYERNKYISETGYSGAFEINTSRWEQNWNNMSAFNRSAYKNKEDYIEKQKEWMKQSQGSEEELKARAAQFARQYEIRQNEQMQQQQTMSTRQQQIEANKTPQQRYRDARQTELDRRRQAYLDEKNRRREAYLQSRGGGATARLTGVQSQTSTPQEQRMLQKAGEWWLSTGRWTEDNYTGDRFVPDDVVKRYQRSDAYRSRLSEYRLPSREQAQKAAEENAIRVQQSDSRRNVNRNIFDSFVLGEDLEIDTDRDGTLERFPAGTAYRNLPGDAINADLRRTGDRPLGYDRLNTTMQERVSSEINNFYSRYKTPEQKAVIENIEKKRKESQAKRDKYNAEIASIRERTIQSQNRYATKQAAYDEEKQGYDRIRAVEDAARERQRKFDEIVEKDKKAKRDQQRAQGPEWYTPTYQRAVASNSANSQLQKELEDYLASTQAEMNQIQADENSSGFLNRYASYRYQDGVSAQDFQRKDIARKRGAVKALLERVRAARLNTLKDLSQQDVSMAESDLGTMNSEFRLIVTQSAPEVRQYLEVQRQNEVASAQDIVEGATSVIPFGAAARMATSATKLASRIPGIRSLVAKAGSVVTGTIGGGIGGALGSLIPATFSSTLATSVAENNEDLVRNRYRQFYNIGLNSLFGSVFGGLGGLGSLAIRSVGPKLGNMFGRFGNYMTRIRDAGNPRNYYRMETQRIQDEQFEKVKNNFRNYVARQQLTTPIDFTTLPPGADLGPLANTTQNQGTGLFGRLFGSDRSTARQRVGAMRAMENTRDKIAAWSTPSAGFFDVRGGFRNILNSIGIGGLARRSLKNRLISQRRKLGDLQSGIGIPDNGPGSSGYTRGGRSTMELTENDPKVQQLARDYIEQLKQSELGATAATSARQQTSSSLPRGAPNIDVPLEEVKLQGIAARHRQIEGAPNIDVPLEEVKLQGIAARHRQIEGAPNIDVPLEEVKLQGIAARHRQIEGAQNAPKIPSMSQEELDRRMLQQYQRIPFNELTPVEQDVMMELQKRVGAANRARTYSLGGLIYASRGTLVPYQPRGTDTVPAMLTPGEFVINKKSAKQHMNLLKAINSGQNVMAKGYNKGGIVNTQYYENGGAPAIPTTSDGVSNISVDSSSLDASFSNFQKYVAEFAGSMSSFVDGVGAVGNLATALQGLGSLNLSGPADSLRNASVSLKGGLESLEKAIGPFSSAATNLATAISNIPPKIELTVGGTIPVVGNITVILEGEGSSSNEMTSDQKQQITESITNAISAKIRDATSGRLNIK